MATYTAVVQRDGQWWIGWIEEMPGVNAQGATRDDLMENLQSALGEAIEMNRADAIADASGEFEEACLIFRTTDAVWFAKVQITRGGGNPVNNRRTAVPRHPEIGDVLAKKICRDLGIAAP
jgi:predicted RNase H-like HicB family nuclease